MTRQLLVKAALVGAAVAVPAGVAVAQAAWVPGSEIAGQTVQVQTNGVANNIYFGVDGTAQITGAGGASVQGTWSAANNMLYLSANGGQECWPYERPFQARQQMTLTSNCQQVTTFIPENVNAPTQSGAGERG